jgi:hypothetical protein
MAEVKNKVVTVESLAAVNTHNQNTYITKTDPTGTGTFTMTGDGNFSGDITTASLMLGKSILSYDTTEGALKISFVTE